MSLMQLYHIKDSLVKVRSSLFYFYSSVVESVVTVDLSLVTMSTDNSGHKTIKNKYFQSIYFCLCL